jgi:CRP-like cAMP-binding protein
MPSHLLRRYPLFALLQPRQLESWLASAQALTAATGETLLQAGTVGVWAYLLLEGQVRVVRPSDKGGEVSLGRLEAGDLFGEYALLPPGKNTATCRVVTPALLLRLPLAPLQSLFALNAQVWPNFKNWLRLHSLLHYLRGRSFLGFMSAPSALALLDSLQSTSFAAGETIQAEGLGADRWYVIEQGQVRLAPDRELGPGDCFGENALLWRSRLTVAEAVTDVSCLSLSRLVFDPPRDSGSSRSLQSLRSWHQGPSRPYVWVGQEEAGDCGLAALAMIGRYHGLDVLVGLLRRAATVGPSGLSLAQLQQTAGVLGLGCRAVRVRPAHLADVVLPVVAHMIDGHYVVLYEVREDGVVVGDPAAGIVTVSVPMFRRACSGNLLLCSVDL